MDANDQQTKENSVLKFGLMDGKCEESCLLSHTRLINVKGGKKRNEV